jgi:hypothetical protein
MQDGIILEDKQINIQSINWNQMSSIEFRELEKKMQDDRKLIRRKKKPVTGNSKSDVYVKIKGQTYRLKNSLYNRLKNMTSDKSKEKLIEEIIETHHPIIEV